MELAESGGLLFISWIIWVIEVIGVKSGYSYFSWIVEVDAILRGQIGAPPCSVILYGLLILAFS
jgi:hypothetical protein